MSSHEDSQSASGTQKGGDALRGEGDRYLVAGIREGDAGAFQQLVDRYSGRLRAYAARRLSGSGIDAEDAVQETFLGLLQSLDRVDSVRSLQAYLFQILRNKIVDLARKRPEAHGMKQIPLNNATDDDSDVHGYEPVSPTGTPSSYARRGETVQVRNQVLGDILDEMISGLRESRNFRDLKVLELLFYGSWKNRDIATEVGVSEPTVTRVKTAALQKLQRLAERHPMTRKVGDLLDLSDTQSNLIRSIWSANLLSCLKRSTLGHHALGALEDDWADYVDFHLHTVGCEFCDANLVDVKGDDETVPPETRERIFASSVGFLRQLKHR